MSYRFLLHCIGYIDVYLLPIFKREVEAIISTYWAPAMGDLHEA